ncbi:unnamed protein product, partial [Laminaria digitata]
GRDASLLLDKAFGIRSCFFFLQQWKTVRWRLPPSYFFARQLSFGALCIVYRECFVCCLVYLVVRDLCFTRYVLDWPVFCSESCVACALVPLSDRAKRWYEHLP